MFNNEFHKVKYDQCQKQQDRGVRETLKKSSKIKGLSDESEKLSDNFKTFESNDIFCKEGKSLSL